MNKVKTILGRALLPLCLLLSQAAWAQNAIEALGVNQQGSDVVLKLTTSQPLSAVPASFSVANPPRIAYDFPGVKNSLGRNTQSFNEGDLRSVNLVQVGDRTRLVLNLKQVRQASARIDGKDLYITIGAGGDEQAKAAKPEQAKPTTHFSEAKPSADKPSVRDINFRPVPPAKGASWSTCPKATSASTSASRGPR